MGREETPTLWLPLGTWRRVLNIALACTVIVLSPLGCVLSGEGEGAGRARLSVLPGDPMRRPHYDRYESLAAALGMTRAPSLDWSAGVREGTVEPLPGVSPDTRETVPLPMDVLLDSAVPGFNVIFSHQSHGYWLQCDSCHPSIFLMQAGTEPISKEMIQRGESCGRCHGAVVFGVETDCSRCHVHVAFEPVSGTGPVPDEVLGDILMDRHSTANYQPAVVFRHWEHLVHFRCSACHPGAFEMRSGANEITMDTLLAGESCGRCHDGLTAFGTSVETCRGCHSNAGP